MSKRRNDKNAPKTAKNIKQVRLKWVENLQLPFRKGFDIKPYIKVEEVKDKRERVVFRFIRLNLTQQSLRTILQARSSGESLRIERHLLTQLRYCILSDGENKYREMRLASGLTFCTYYESFSWQTDLSPDKIMMRSVISPDGDIIHQIRRDSLEIPERCLAIASAHHWILEQLLNQLGINLTVWLNWLAGGLSLLIVSLIVIGYRQILSINPLTLLALLLMWWLLQKCCKILLKLLLPIFRRWAFRQLFLHLFSPNPKDKNISKTMLGRLVP